jgi:hypothetical protein
MTPDISTTRHGSRRFRWLPTALGLFVFVNLAVAQETVAPEVSECIRCHREKTPQVYQQYASGVHALPAVGCVGCHGGDPRAKTERRGHDRDKGYVGVSSSPAASARCAACHEDALRMQSSHLDKSVVEQWRGSAHGKSLANGRSRSKGCRDCHGSHGILSYRDPRSPTHPTSVPSTCGQCHAREREQMAASPHYEALRNTGMPSCVRCHGKHGTNIPAFRATCEECHQAVDDPAHGIVQRMATLIERADNQIEALDRVIASAKDKGPGVGQPRIKARLLKAEQKRVRGLRERVRQVSHSLDVGFLTAAVDRLQKGVKTVTAIAAADLDGTKEFTESTVALLFAAGVFMLLMLSVGFSVFMFRFGRRVKKIRPRWVPEAAS